MARECSVGAHPLMTRKPLFVVVILLAISYSYARPAIASLRISRDTVLTGNLIVSEEQTVIIDPGVRIQFAAYKNIAVLGTLIARGTPHRPIAFTCQGARPATSKEACWQGLYVKGKNASATFAHCRFEGAFRNLIWGASPKFDTCAFVGNHYGLYCTAKAIPHITGCHFEGNTFGIFVDRASPLLLSNTITKNRRGLHLQLSAQPAAGKNVIWGNETDIHTESALGQDSSGMSIQSLWDALKAVY